MKKFNKGFTLIELLVVIAIIGILAGIVLTALGRARAAARDAKRAMEIRQIQTALEAYYSVKGFYPGEGNCDATAAPLETWRCHSACNCWNQTNPEPSYISKDLIGEGWFSRLPIDPINDPNQGGASTGARMVYYYEPSCVVTSGGGKQSYELRYFSESGGAARFVTGGIRQTSPCVACGGTPECPVNCC